MAAQRLRLRAHAALRDHDGFIESLYHLLWVKNINGESCPEVLAVRRAW